MSSRSKKLVAMAQDKAESETSSKEQQLLPLYTEDDIQIGVLEPLSCCPIQDSSTRDFQKEIKNTDGCFLKVSSNCNGFSIQPSIENESVEVVFCTNDDVYPSDAVNDTDIFTDHDVSNKNYLLVDTVSSPVPIDSTTDYNFEISPTDQPITNNNSKFYLN